MTSIPAKPTIYAGRHFRSRLEASWACWFDAMAWRWTYEPSPVVADYQPDFLLDGAHIGSPVYVECKPERYREWLDRHEADIERWKEHVRESVPIPLLVVIGRPGIWIEGQLDHSALNVASILFWIGPARGLRHSPEPSGDVGDVQSLAVWFTGCDRCGENGLAWIGDHLECACLRARWQRIPRAMVSAAETVRNMAWDRHGAEYPQLHHLNRPDA